MEVGAPNTGVVNMTRAIEAVSPMLNNPRKTIIRVEALVSLAAVLVFVQFILGVCKRLWHNSIVNFFLKVCNKSMFPLIVYILGTMQTSPIKNSVYPVWAVSLIIASEATGAIKQPDPPTVENLISIYIEGLRYAFYYVVFSQLLNPSDTKFSWPPGHRVHYRPPNASSACTNYLFSLVVFSKLTKGIIGLMLGTSHSVIVARWMKKKANSDAHSDCGPKSMDDYNYLVRYSIKIHFKNRPAKIPTNEVPSSVTTVNQIWGSFQNSNDGISADHKKRLKDVCLSFALFELLKRRYMGLVCAEASLTETKYFVSSELLGDKNDYERAFGIVQTELGFFYDFLFTKHQLTYTTGLFPIFWIFLFVLFLVKIILICMVGVYAIKKSLVLETPSPIIEVHSAKADYIIALAFICIILMVYLLQAVFYLASDWVKVSLTCAYVKRKSCAPIAFILKNVFGLLCKMNIPAGCRNTIGQTSIISDRSIPSDLNKMMIDAVKVSNAVKNAIANAVKNAIENSLNSADGELIKQETALMTFNEYSETLKDHSQIEVMLILHIATDYCDLDLSNKGEDCNLDPSNMEEGRHVAVHLSSYYAYLIAFVPELLPYHLADIRELRGTVREEIETLPTRTSSTTSSGMKMLQTAFLAPYTRSKMFNIMKDLAGTGKEDNPTTVFMKGVKLGKQLASMSDGAQRWKMLAEFWAESIVYITPSHHTAKHHMEHLESGGEFLTQIWTLLSHAGILNVDRAKDQGAKPAQPQTA